MTQRFERIDSLAGFDAVEGEWRDLFDRAGQPSPFLDFDWVRMCFARLTGTRAKPLVALVREDGEPVLALPLHRVARPVIVSRLYGMRTLLPQYTDGLLATGHDGQAAVEALLAGLGKDWRIRTLGLERLPAHSPIAALTTASQRLRVPIGNAGGAALPDGFDAYFARFGRQSRSQVRRMERLMDEAGGMAIRMATPETVDADFDWMLARKRAWTPKSGTLRPWLSSAAAEDDLRQLSRKWSGDGRLQLSVLEVGGSRAAAAMTLRSRGEAVCYFITHDPQFAANSPGRVLMLRSMERLAAEGTRYVDFMLGDADWKTRLRTGERRIERIRVRLG